MNDTRTGKKEKNQHIQVFVRVRPLNSNEKAGKCLNLVEVPSNKELVVRERPQDKLSKKFVFDEVFGPHSKQIDVYNAVVSPLLEEVLAGYNCTVFAYGQTGTGKTFTMEGISNDPTLNWQSDTHAGIIPRSLSHLFDELRTLESQEFTVRVSFLELYNEELFDLLATADDASKIRIYEDVSKKGSVIIHGLEEVTVHDKSEVYKILEKASVKRHTAATLMNAQSSRSHTVFSITVHIKENTVDGEELLKTGKLNLVDLAGSENVGRSGAVDRRAREAGNINQSLLTLGRVITALVERAPHIPYRESKLTRILQESLGGRTKTSIIATISGASINIEETLSTLDYAHRAKNITNRPEINQKLSKKALLKEYTEEIERLRRDLLAARERNGVYLTPDSYNEMQTLIEFQKKEIEEKINHIKALTDTMQNKEKLFASLETKYEETSEELNETKNVLKTVKTHLHETKLDRDEKNHLLEKHVSTEKELLKQADDLLKVADVATADTHKLHDKIIRKSQVEQQNQSLLQQFKEEMKERIHFIENKVSNYSEDLTQFCSVIKEKIEKQMAESDKNMETIEVSSRNHFETNMNASDKLSSHVEVVYTDYEQFLKTEISIISNMTEEEIEMWNRVTNKLAPRIQQLVCNGIAENLRNLNESVTRQFECLIEQTKESIELMCNYRYSDRDQILENMNGLKQNLQSVLEYENNITTQRQNFVKAFDELYQKHKALQEFEESTILQKNNLMKNIDTFCRNVDDYVVTSCNDRVKEADDLKNTINSEIEQIEQKITNATKQNCLLYEESIEEGDRIANVLKSEAKISCDHLLRCKDTLNCNISEMQKKMKQDQTCFSTSLNEMKTITIDANSDLAKMVIEHRTKINETSSEINDEHTRKKEESTTVGKEINEMLHNTLQKFNKFVVEELRNDTPTGSTPLRKDFRYPRQLAATSPHERILDRFRQTRLENNMSSDEDNTILQNNSSTEGITICNISDQKSGLLTDAEIFASTPNRNELTVCNAGLTKAASMSDLSNSSTHSPNTTAHSDLDIYSTVENKENVSYKFVKPTNGMKRLSKPKTTNRPVLQPCNK